MYKLKPESCKLCAWLILHSVCVLGGQVDCWALGVLLYALVYSSMPFDGASHSMLTEQISQGRYHRPNPPSGKRYPYVHQHYKFTLLSNSLG